MCHKVPAFASQMPDNVRFLNIGPAPLLPPSQSDVQLDKGLKYILGILWALNDGASRFIMPCDGDDFLHRDLMRKAFSNEERLGNTDGFVVTNGVHALVEWTNERLSLLKAYKVRDFHLTCGTCRIIRVGSLQDALAPYGEKLPTLAGRWKTDAAGRETVVDPKSLKTLIRALEPDFDDHQAIIRLLGRHAQQFPAFRFTPLKGNLVAKGCGHGNHDGPRGGDVHWHRITGNMKNRAFIRQFGLKGALLMPEKSQYRATLSGYLNILRNLGKRISDRTRKSKKRHF
jgi:hypothetical protein